MSPTDSQIIQTLIRQMDCLVQDEIHIMEVCGTHTHQIAKLGIRNILPSKIRLLSGPGCPVCVTSPGYIDAALKFTNIENTTILTFGDIVRVPGSHGNLFDKIKTGKDIKVLYSPYDAINLALNNKERNYVFLAVGFETTAPLYAAMIQNAEKLRMRNLFFFTSIKLMDPVIRAILEEEQRKINGMLCPGHVASVVGAKHFRFIAEEYGVASVVCGFEGKDILAAIYGLVQQIEGKQTIQCLNLYKQCVSNEGNITAQKLMKEVYVVTDDIWRGIGTIKKSALRLRDEYQIFDAVRMFGISVESLPESKMCDCKDVLKGLKAPGNCSNFGTNCTPDHALGPCMVSSEGACAAHYRYGRLLA